jgi:transposase
VMDRLVLSDAAWERIAPLIIGRPDQKGSTGRDNRMFVEGVLWIVRTGAPGVICLRHSGTGTACSGASVDGAAKVFGGGSSRRCPTIRTSNI